MTNKQYAVCVAISIHAPRVGSDRELPGVPDAADDFNPRSPCGERHDNGQPTDGGRDISIHAPRVGSDFIGKVARKLSANFNPRSPCGERPTKEYGIIAVVRFQSTLPVWGATPTGSSRPAWRKISIHAPRVGSDRRTDTPTGGKSNFNPRSPCGERLACAALSADISAFQSTLPVWGATAGQRGVCRVQQDFNPRSPCGERPGSHYVGFAIGTFQSTLPVWGATWRNQCGGCIGMISIHAPRVGSDPAQRPPERLR